MAWPTGFIPVLPLKNTVIFPTVSQVIKVGRDKSLKAIDKARHNDDWIVTVTQKNPDVESRLAEDFFTVGTLCKIESIKKLSDGSQQVVVRGIKRVRISLVEDAKVEYFQTSLIPVDEVNDLDLQTEKSLVKSLLELSEELFQSQESNREVLRSVSHVLELGHLIAAQLDLKPAIKQGLLEIDSLKNRTLEILKVMSEYKANIDVQNEIRNKLYNKFGQNQRQQILREQLRVIKEELGESSEDSAEGNYQEKIKGKNLPTEAHKLAMMQAERIEQLNSSSPEFHVIKNHLEFLLSLPWDNSSESAGVDLVRAREQLDQDHFGLEKIKKRILQSLSVMKLTQNKKGSILLFLGPPGVGKTSLGKSIAEALGRKYERISLGGTRDDAEIRGHRRTYVGALPGRILSSIKRVGQNDCVLILDEIDKMGRGYSGDPAATLLEVLDPEQNQNLTDHYLDTPFDLSRVMFIATANSLDGIPGPLLDRMEIIEVGSYTNLEKIEIAEKYLVPKMLKDLGLEANSVQISRPVLSSIISSYTREAGVRGLKRCLMQIGRFATQKVVESRELGVEYKPLQFEEKDFDEVLGTDRIYEEKNKTHKGPGVVAGLAWTPFGGDLLFIESAAMPGSGRLMLTGQLGEVMRESAELAVSLLKSRMAFWKVSFDFQKTDLHIHAPAGAIPKDGPSAGVTIITSLASLLTGIELSNDKAMTGEITLTGAVLPVGGIKEKLIAAHRRGRKKVLIPQGNEKDLLQLPIEVRSELDVKLASHVDEVLEWALGLKFLNSVRYQTPMLISNETSGVT